MSPWLHTLISFDAPAALAAVLAAVSCGLLGSVLLLRRQSLMGDAISHSILPGLVVAFLVSHQRSTAVMVLGAAIAALVGVALIGALRRYARIESGAAMGVVFSILFAFGILLLERAAARHIDLDADCVLHGQIEMITWFPPETWGAFWRWETFVPAFDEATGVQVRGVPRPLLGLGATAVVVICGLAAFFKEVRISSFDPALARSLGVPASAVNAGVLVLVALAAVTAFEAVGSILVVAMLICPAATARLLTDRFRMQLVLSGVIACLTAIVGYLAGAHAPLVFGSPYAVSVAGAMTTVGGVLFFAVAVGSPSHGAAARFVRRLRLTFTVACEDALAALYRIEESGRGEAATGLLLRRVLEGHGIARRFVVARLVSLGRVRRTGERLALTESGRSAASRLVRTHRLWEVYLVRELGLSPDHVHETAERLEHLRLGHEDLPIGEGGSMPGRDPHDRVIPAR